MSDTFKFTELRMNAPWDNLTTALGLIQAEILASDSNLIPEVMFGAHHFKRSGLEAALALLSPLTGPVEDLSWEDPA